MRDRLVRAGGSCTMVTMPPRVRDWRPFFVFVAALLLFSLRLTLFEARQTDISALRVLAGDVPYRDFWTMYAPGSFVLLAGVFRLTGAQLIVSNALGIVTAAAGVAVYFTLVRRVATDVAAMLAAALVATVYFGTGYSDGFTSYPPALLLILVAVRMVVDRAEAPGALWAVRPGLLLGAAALFKHDVAGYAAVALAIALVMVRASGGMGRALGPLAVLAGCTALLPLGAVVVLVRLGAAADAWTDLVQWPLGDFKYVRPEYFPLVVHLQTTLVGTVRELRGWATCNLPTVAVVMGLLSLRRSPEHTDRRSALLVAFAVVAFALHWWAAHVQINTNAISLAAWGAVVAAVGLSRIRLPRPVVAAMCGVLGVWMLLAVAESGYLAAQHVLRAHTPVGLPHLSGIRATPEAAADLRDLSMAMLDAGPRDAPLLFVSRRNDMMIYAQSVPFWLTDRRPATRYAELHPGITDVERGQREMLAQMARGRAPVVVREYRFDDETLDATKAALQAHVPVGSTLLDSWIDEHYVPSDAYGQYEVMAPRADTLLRAIP